MDIFKLLAAIIAFTICALWGYRKNRELKERSLFLGEIVSLLEHFAIGIKSLARTSDELLEQENGVFARLVKAHRSAQHDIREAWEKACGELPEKSEERALLSELGRSLGSSDTESTLRLLEQCTEQIAKLYAFADEEQKKRGKAVFQIGALCGIGVAILII